MKNVILSIILVIICLLALSKSAICQETAEEKASDLFKEATEFFVRDVRDSIPWEERISLYQKIITEFPETNIAAYTHYCLANLHLYSYWKYLFNNASQFDQEHLLKRESQFKAVLLFDKLVTEYPDATFPNCYNPFYDKQGIRHGYPMRFKVEPGIKMIPIAQFRLAELYNYHLGGFPGKWADTTYVKKSIQEYESLIEKFPDAMDADSTYICLSAYVALMHIYSNPNLPLFNREKALNISDILMNQYPNQKFGVGLYTTGYTHPEALLYRGLIQVDEKTGIEICKQVIEEYGDIRASFWGYKARALGKISSFQDKKLVIAEYRKIAESNYDKKIKAHAQYYIATIYERHYKDDEQAIIEYQKVIDKYWDVSYWCCPTSPPTAIGKVAERTVKHLQKNVLAPKKIAELTEKAKTELGASFDPAEFNKLISQFTINLGDYDVYYYPLDEIETGINEYIQYKREHPEKPYFR